MITEKEQGWQGKRDAEQFGAVQARGAQIRSRNDKARKAQGAV